MNKTARKQVSLEVTDRPSDAVLSAVATATDEDPLEFDDCLYDVVDPDALDALYRNDAPVRVTFAFNGYHVTIDGDTVAVEALEAYR